MKRLRDYELAELRVLVDDAFAATGAEREALVREIVAWREGIVSDRARRLLWRRRARQQALIELLRSTNPNRLPRREVVVGDDAT